jgi:hypothetical protein
MSPPENLPWRFPTEIKVRVCRKLFPKMANRRKITDYTELAIRVLYRWVINGSIASLWVYALPPKRQTEISVYVGRLGALSMWRAWRKHGGWSIKYGEVLMFALGWSFLLQLRSSGWQVEGLMRRAIKFIEGKPLPTPTPPPSSFPSEVNLTALQRSKDSFVSIADSGFGEEGLTNIGTNGRAEGILPSVSS